MTARSRDDDDRASSRSGLSEGELAARLADVHALHRGLAHDLRGPLNAMVLQLELLRSDLERPDTSGSARRRVETLGRELDELRMGVECLLALVQPPATLAGSEWDAGELVASVARLLAPAARQRGVALETRVPSPLPASGERGNALATLLRLALQGLAGLPDHARLVLEAEADRVGGGVAFRVRLEAAGAEPSALAEWCRDAGAIERLGAELEAAPSDPRRVVLTLRVPPGEATRPAGQAAGSRGRASP